MENKAQLARLETEVLQDRWACRDRKALLVMPGRLERQAAPDLQVQGESTGKMERKVLLAQLAQLVLQEREESRDHRE